MQISLQCIKCGYKSENKYDLTCKNHSPYYSYFEVTSDTSSESLLGEGDTPLIELKSYSSQLRQVYAKCEYENPSGSVKDREVSAIFKFVKAEKIEEVVMVSGGSGARSAAYFADRLKIKYQCISAGDYEENFKAAIDQHLFYNVTPGINPLASEGTKLIAHELYKELNEIDAIIVPVGNGTMLAGIWKGVKEVSPSKLPKMIGVEMQDGDPVKKALEQNADFIELTEAPESLGKAICTKASFSSPKAIQAILQSHGQVIAVSESELIDEIKQLKQSNEISPSNPAIATLAALRKYPGKGNIVCILSG